MSAKRVGPDRAELLDTLERELGVLLRRSKRVLAERAAAVHEDLPGGAYLLLVTVHRQGGMRSSELAELFTLDKGSVSRQVQQLLDLGLLQGQPDPADRRARVLRTTRRAEKRIEAVQRQRRDRLDASLASWGDDDLEGFVTRLAAYNAVLEE